MSELALAISPETLSSPIPTPNRLIEEHTALVRRVARKVHRSAGASIDQEELVQTGMLALVQASRSSCNVERQPSPPTPRCACVAR